MTDDGKVAQNGVLALTNVINRNKQEEHKNTNDDPDYQHGGGCNTQRIGGQLGCAAKQHACPD
jgi:hypothetical protein